MLENDCLKVKIEGGAITSLIDRASGREIVAEGKKANQLVIMDDKPLYWQAWDVRIDYICPSLNLRSHVVGRSFSPRDPQRTSPGPR